MFSSVHSFKLWNVQYDRSEAALLIFQQDLSAGLLRCLLPLCAFSFLKYVPAVLKFSMLVKRPAEVTKHESWGQKTLTDLCVWALFRVANQQLLIFPASFIYSHHLDSGGTVIRRNTNRLQHCKRFLVLTNYPFYDGTHLQFSGHLGQVNAWRGSFHLVSIKVSEEIMTDPGAEGNVSRRQRLGMFEDTHTQKKKKKLQSCKTVTLW